MIIFLLIIFFVGFIVMKIINSPEDPNKVLEKERKIIVKSIEQLAKESPKINFTPATQPFSVNTEKSENIDLDKEYNSLSTADKVLRTLKPETAPNLSLYNVVTLDVPAYKQEYKNSCEESALRMVLAYYDITATEMEIVEKVGYKPRNWDYKNNIWDDPYEMYVGAIDGKSPNGTKMTGYGTFAPPIAKAARAYGREAQDYSPVTASFIAEQIYNGNPVILWGFFKTPTYVKYSWKTDAGKVIEAYSGEHARVVVGVVGDRDNPTGFFLNDPYTGEGKVYWSTERLMKHINIWGNLTNQAVLVK